MDDLARRMENFVKFVLALAIALLLFLMIRSMVLSAERARSLERDLTDLRTSCQSLRVKWLDAQDALVECREKLAARPKMPVRREQR